MIRAVCFEVSIGDCFYFSEEDDTIVDSWYLLGWVNKLRAVQEKEENYNGNARYYLNRAKEIHKKNPTKDVQMVDFF